MRSPPPLPLLATAVILAACGERGPGPLTAHRPAATITLFATDSQGAEIREIAVGNTVWSVNRGAPSVAEYSADGQLVWHGLEQGEGPDQARTIWSLVAEGDSAFAWDPLTRRLFLIKGRQAWTTLTFDFTTTHTISNPAHGINFGHPGRIRRFGDGWVTYATEGPQWHAFDLGQFVLLRFDRTGQVVDTLADMRSAPLYTDRSSMLATGPKELVPIPFWDVCGGDRLVLFDPQTTTLRWRGTDGQEPGSMTFPFIAGTIPESFLREHMFWQLQIAAQGKLPMDTLRAWLEPSLEQQRPILGTVEPFAVKMFCRGSDEVWVERFSVDAPPRGFSRHWLQIDLRSRTSREVELPSGFQAMAADSTRIYGAVEDEDGVQQVGWIPVPEPAR